MLGLDHVRDRLCLAEVELPREKRPPREFAGLSLPHPGRQAREHDVARDHRRAVDVQFHDVLAGVAGRGDEQQR